MDYYKSILICGGDKRQRYLYKMMKNDGLNVKTYALSEEDFVRTEDINKFDVVILPLPVSLDGINLNAPCMDYEIKIDDIFSHLLGSQIVLGGMCDKLNYDMTDYYENEKFKVQNAIPTAEGAVRIAMEKCDFTINGAKCLVAGYGRIGKVLSKMLVGLGADVTVCARNKKELEISEVFGCKACDIDFIGDIVCDYDIIFNTVPKTVITSEMLGKISKSTLIIELASKPYGIDMAAARALGRNVVLASGLPGKFTPKTAGKILKDVIMKILFEMEV